MAAPDNKLRPLLRQEFNSLTIQVRPAVAKLAAQIKQNEPLYRRLVAKMQQRKKYWSDRRKRNRETVIAMRGKPAPRQTSNEFYASREWRELRYEAFKCHGRRCACCGATPSDGIRLHVDHIKPRSLYPSLELKLENLQILCEDCNIGKSNKHIDDWREAPEPSCEIEPESQSHMNAITNH